MEFKISKLRNFLYFIYILNKSKFDFMNSKRDIKNMFKSYELDAKKASYIKTLMTLEDEEVEKFIKEDQDFNQIVSINYQNFSSFFEENLHFLEKIKKDLEKLDNEFNYKGLDMVVSFYKSELPSIKSIYIFLGNIDNMGRGFVKNNTIFLFPRMFKDYNYAEEDFKMFIHEFIHLMEYNSKKEIGEEREFFENVARCFAPKGILFNKEFAKENQEFWHKFVEIFESKGDIFNLYREMMNCGKH